MTSRLAEMQARFQQRQMQEKEEKLLKLYENQQQRAFERVGRGSAGSNTSIGSTGGGKVRQMFDERRQKAGVDKSYPLEPLKNKVNPRGSSRDRKNANLTSRTVVKSTVQKSVTSVKNGKPLVNKREIVKTVYNNNNGDETFKQQKYEDDSVDNFVSKSNRDIVEMMNNHNLYDGLDNEEMPKIGFDEVDDSYQSEKSANVGGAIPSQNGLAKKSAEPKPLKSNGVTPIARKESKPPSRKPVRASPNLRTSPPSRTSPPTSRVSSSPALTPKNSTPSSPTKAPGATMQNKTPSRAPLSNRPSVRQTAKSPVVRDDLADCSFCGRRFAVDRLQKHEDICSKTGKKKRKVYDATKHRVTGTELESYVLSTKKRKGGAATSTKASTKPSQKKDWRKTHDEFIAAIRSAKQTQAHLAKGGKLSDLPPPPPSSNPDYVQCPHCGRRFNESAAERHIPKCASFQFNKPKIASSSKPTRK